MSSVYSTNLGIFIKDENFEISRNKGIKRNEFKKMCNLVHDGTRCHDRKQ